MMTEMDSQRKWDELVANLNFTACAVTDEVLVAAAKSGDHPAFVELWTRHSNKAFKTTYRITGNRDDAEDAVQDAWLKAYLHLKTFDGRAQFSTWLTRIAINSSLMILRKKRACLETSMEFMDSETWQQWEIAAQTKSAEERIMLPPEFQFRFQVHLSMPWSTFPDLRHEGIGSNNRTLPKRALGQEWQDLQNFPHPM